MEPHSPTIPGSSVQISEMSIADYDEVRALLTITPGITWRTADARPAVERYLARNPGFSFVARSATHLVGCVMCGHDGRRGYLQHLAVSPAYRMSGLGRRLIEYCLTALAEQGIGKVHLDVLIENKAAEQFWQHLGWKRRDDLHRYSWINSNEGNA
jgi:N-acetylglutamate synthase